MPLATQSTSSPGNRWLWWYYIAALYAAGLGRMFERLAKESGGFCSQFGPLIGAIIVTTGIIGWLRNWRLLNAWFWRVVHLCLILCQLLAILFATYIGAFGVYVPAAIVLSLAAFLVPAIIALFRYSYRSNGLWSVS